LICSFNFLILLTVCLNISTVINIKILTNSNQQTQSYKFTSHIAAFLSVVLITEMLEICIQTSNLFSVHKYIYLTTPFVQYRVHPRLSRGWGYNVVFVFLSLFWRFPGHGFNSTCNIYTTAFRVKRLNNFTRTVRLFKR
jgi:hypothetical protein